MTSKITQAIIAGIVATIVFTIVTLIAPMMGMPKMNPPAMLSMMMGFPIVVGWIIHFMIGIIFAVAYAFFFINMVKGIDSKLLRGIIFGIAAFIFAQIMLAIMGTIWPSPPMEGSPMLILIGSIIGHIIFGITVAFIVKEPFVKK